MIKVRLKAVDGFSKTRRFKTLAGARRFAQNCVGKTPEFGLGLGEKYAISSDGVARITVDGATLRELFPEEE